MQTREPAATLAEAYRATFGVCALSVLLAAAMSLLLRETRGRNISAEVQGAAVRS